MKIPLAYSSVPMAPSHNSGPRCTRSRKLEGTVFTGYRNLRRPRGRFVIISVSTHDHGKSGAARHTAGFFDVCFFGLLFPCLLRRGRAKPTIIVSKVADRVF